MTKLTIQDLDLMTREDEWGGYGYLGERNNIREAVADGERKASDIDRLHAVDQMVIASANAKGMTYEQLFAWANSRDGRHFADRMVGWSDDIQAAWAATAKWGIEPAVRRAYDY